jgi:sulfide:quinone oxidoreductase
MPSSPFRVVVAGGGVAGIESLLALRSLAGARVELTLLSPDDRFRLRALAIAEPFSLGHAREVPYTRIRRDLGVRHLAVSVTSVDDAHGELTTSDGAVVEFDALLLTTGAVMTDGLEHAMTWRPDGSQERLGGLLRDLEEGYSKRVAFVVPAGPTWPLPAYELALMTAREVAGMGIDPDVTVVTAEAEPLSGFGSDASATLRSALEAAGIELLAGTTVRVVKRAGLRLETEPIGPDIPIDRVVAIPVLRGPAIEGVACDEYGFVRVDGGGMVEGCARTWAAGDCVVSPLKMGGLAANQGSRAAHAIAVAAGAMPPLEDNDELVLHAVLMTGETSIALDGRALAPVPGAPHWWPARKVGSRYLEEYLARIAIEAELAGAAA